MISVSLMNINSLRNPKVYQEKIKLVDEDRLEKIEKLHFEGDRVRSLGAGLLLQNVLETNHCNREIIYGIQGKPYLKKNPEYFFSLSHSGDYVVCAIADFEIGIDVQKHKKVNLNFAKRFFTRDEQDSILAIEDLEQREKLFYQIWTRKESYIKYTGIGMKQDISKISVLLSSEIFFVDYDNIRGYSIAICMKKSEIDLKLNYYHI